MNEIFGEENFVSSMIWEGTNKNDSRLISNNHDYVLVYAKNKSSLKELAKETPWRVRKEGLDEIFNEANNIMKKYPNPSRDDYNKASDELKRWFRSVKNTPSYSHKHYNCIDSKGVYFPSDISWPGGGGPKYDVLHPETGKPVKKSARGWAFPTPERMQRAISDGEVHFGPDETTVPKKKTYLSDTSRQVLGSVFYCDRRGAAKRLRTLMDGNEVFDFPKDEYVLMNIIEAFTNPGDMILDVFGGSGTTGHAVLQLNAESGTTRNFIVATLPEQVNLKTKTGKNAAKLGYQNVSDITASRLKLTSEWLEKTYQPGTKVDLGFETFRLVPSLSHSWSQDSSEQITLESFIEKVSSEDEISYPYETVTEILIQAGRPLTGTRKAFDNGSFSGCQFGESVLIIESLYNPDTAASALIELSKDLEVVCAFDRVFSGNDSVKMNFKHILKDRGMFSLQGIE